MDKILYDKLAIDQEIKTTNATIQLVDGNIFYVLYQPDMLIEVSDFEETRKVYEDLSQGNPLKFIVEFPPFSSATTEARKWAEEHQVDAVAEAIIFYGLAQRLLIKFYLLFRKQAHPVKLYTNRDDAFAWLKNLS